jgi:hypothetical protein
MTPKKANGTIMRPALWLSLSLVALAVPLHGSDQVSLSVSPRISYAPSTLSVRVRLEPSAENRAIQIIADGADFYRSSVISLDGDRGPATVALNIPNIPGGDYNVAAVLLDDAGRPRARTAQNVTVLGQGRQP